MDVLISAALARYRTVLMIFWFIVIAGSIAYVTVPKESSPDVQIPIIYVSMTLEGVSPEDGERLLLRPMEKKLASVEGVKDMKSEATEGFASVVLEFEAGFNKDKALEDVRARVDEAKPDLPQDADEPSVNEVNFSMFPIINVILTGDVSERTMITVARDLRDKLERLSPVLEAKLSGDREEVLEIAIDPLTFENYHISPSEVLRRVDANNVLVAAGEMDTGSGRYSIKVPGLVEGYEDLKNLVLIDNGNAVVTLSDVATIRRHFKDPESYARVDGERAIGLAVSKRLGANIIDTVAQIRALVEQERDTWPAGIHVTYSQDNSNQVRTMLSDLENNVIFAVLLVMLVIMLALGLRSAGLISLAVPGSFLIGILCISSMGMTMNIVVLFSLILSVGMLVDSAIIINEYADKLMDEGTPAKEAYGKASVRMAWPIISSTLTTLVVFMPLLFWPGIVGQFMKYLPITLIATLTGSLLMALIFLPVIGTRLARFMKTHGMEARGGMAESKGFKRFAHNYGRALDRVLHKPWRFMGGLSGIVFLLMALFGALGPGVEFFPKIEPENVNLLIRARGNLSVEEKDAMVKQVEASVADLTSEVKVLYAQAGKVSLREVPEDTIGVIQMELMPWDKRRKADELLETMVGRTKNIPGVIVESAKQEEGPPVGKPVQLEFRSRYPELLIPAVTEFRAAMDEIGGFINIEDERPVPKIEWEYTVNREMAGRNNISMIDVGNVIKLVSRGVKIDEYRPDDADDEIDIVVRFPEDKRTLSQIERLRINTDEGLVPIGNFIEREAKQSVGTLHRIDAQRVINVKADLEPGVLADEKVKQVQAWLKQGKLDPRIEIRFRGEDEEQKEASAFLSGAFGIALFLMALILVTQFNSVYYMVVIMSAVFFSTGGVFLGLLVTYHPFGIVMCGVGIIALAGIVVNNNIIFIDTYLLLRKEGMPVREALIVTGEDRLRPILLTAGTTVLGLIPMVMGMNIDFLNRDVSFGAPSSQWWTQLSTAIAGGLTFATILTLFFTPCLIYVKERDKEKKTNQEPLILRPLRERLPGLPNRQGRFLRR